MKSLFKAIRFVESEWQDGSNGEDRWGQKSGSVVFHDLDFSWELILSGVGDLEFETTHACNVVHNESVAVLGGHLVEWVTFARTIFSEIVSVLFPRFWIHFSACVVLPKVDADVSREPSDTGVRENKDVASVVRVDLVDVTSQEIDIFARFFVSTTLSFEAFVVGSDEGLSVGKNERGSKCECSFHYNFIL